MTVNVFPMHDVEAGIGEQSAWGTAKVAGADFVKQYAVPSTLTPGLNVRMPDRMSDIREPLDEDIRVDSDQQEHVMSFSGQVTKDTIAEHVFAVCQNATEAATTPFQKVLAPPPTSGQPDFDGNDEGMFATLIVRPRTGLTVCRMIEDAVGRSLNLTLNPANNGGRLAHTTEWFGRKFTPNATITSAGLVKRAVDYFNYSDIVLQTVDATTYTLADMNITLNNAAAGAGIDDSDLTIYRGVALGRYALSGTLSFMWETGLETLLATPDEVRTIAFQWGATGVDGFCEIYLECKFGAATIEEGEHRIINIPIIGCKESSAMFRFTIADEMDRSW